MSVPSPDKVHNRTRGPNFTKEEQLHLFTCLKPYMHIVECKKSDKVKLSDKHNAWGAVTKAYNSKTKGCHRTTNNLISCYRNTKSKIKKQHSDIKMQLKDPIYKTVFMDVLEENGKDWDSSSIASDNTSNPSPPPICQEGFEEIQIEIKKEKNLDKRNSIERGDSPTPSDDDDDMNSRVNRLHSPIYNGNTQSMSHNEKAPNNPIDISTRPSSSILMKPSRIEMLKKKNASIQRLSEQKSELIQLQKQALQMELDHKAKVYKIELENLLLQQEMKKKELHLLDLKIMNESKM